MKKLKKLLLLLTVMACFAVPVAAVCVHTVQVEAATKKFTGWKKDSTGKYWFYYEKGKKVKGEFRHLKDKSYYLRPSDGRMVTGKRKIDKYYYIFDKTGAMYKKTWVKYKKNWYYLRKSGHAVATGFFDKDGQRYYFGTDAIMKTGFVNVGKSTYYFSPQQVVDNKVTYPEGSMRTGKVRIKKNWYYFKKSAASKGKMHKGTITIKGKKYYFKTDGVMHTGWRNSNGKSYYFDVPNGDMVVSTTKVISSIIYSFDADGVATKQEYVIDNKGRVKVWDHGKAYYLKKEYINHPGIANNKVTDDELMAAFVYCEAGDQGLAGMTAVALTVYNRIEDISAYYPSTLRYVLYQTGQYSVVENGSLLTRLRNPKGTSYTTCMKAVTNAKKIIEKYVNKGTNRRILGISTETMGGKEDFDCLYFMSKTSFNNLGLSWSKCETFQYKDHVFFTKWVN